jgi:hypothetical protein
MAEIYIVYILLRDRTDPDKLLLVWIQDRVRPFRHLTKTFILAVLRIRIRMFLGLLDPETLVRGTDPELRIRNYGSFFPAKIVIKTLISTSL